MNELTQREKEIVIARLEASSGKYSFSSGGGATLSKAELIKLIEKGDPVGEEFVQIQFAYLRSFRNSELTNILVNS